jgi:hypothetical protein
VFLWVCVCFSLTVSQPLTKLSILYSTRKYTKTFKCPDTCSWTELNQDFTIAFFGDSL